MSICLNGCLISLPVLGIVGFAGCLYYMFKGLATVQEDDKSSTPTEKIDEIDRRLKEIELNK